jgi:hypothetical protein
LLRGQGLFPLFVGLFDRSHSLTVFYG